MRCGGGRGSGILEAAMLDVAGPEACWLLVRCEQANPRLVEQRAAEIAKRRADFNATNN